MLGEGKRGRFKRQRLCLQEQKKQQAILLVFFIHSSAKKEKSLTVLSIYLVMSRYSRADKSGDSLFFTLTHARPLIL
jgi:hypothetical protein